MQSTETDRPCEFSWKHFLKQYIVTDTTTLFQSSEKLGWTIYNVAIEYANLMSRNLTKMSNFFTFLISKSSALTSCDHFYSIGHAFFEGRFGRFIIKSLEICKCSLERIFKRLELLTIDTIVVVPLEKRLILQRLNGFHNDATGVSLLPNEESSEPLQPTLMIEPSIPSNFTLPFEKDESIAEAAESKPEMDSLPESMPSSTRTIVYENVTGFEKLFVLMVDAFLLFPLNAAIALLRFLRLFLRYCEECVHPTNPRRRAQLTSLPKNILATSFRSLYSDVVRAAAAAAYRDDSVIRLEHKNFPGVSGSNEEFLDKEMDYVNIYWEETDSDYKPMDASSDTYTETDIEISLEELNHILKSVEKSQEMFPLENEICLMQSNCKDNCSNPKELAPLKKTRKRKRKRKRQSKSCMTKTTAVPDNPALKS